MAAVRPAQPLPIMTTLYIQTLPQYWIRRAGSVVQRGGYCIVPLVRQPNWIGFLQRAPGLRLTQKNAALIFRLTHRNAWLAGNKEKDNYGPALSPWELHAPAGGYARTAPAGNCSHCGGSCEPSRGCERIDRSTAKHSLPRRRLDRAAGYPSRSGQPHERVRALSPGAHGAGAHDQTVRRGTLGRAGGCEERSTGGV